jgi:DNA repair exonuclease SbcCD ATPase subunit
MKLLEANLKGYIGFYNGMGLDEVHIDFRKCQNDIILIIGMNGSGKSTLLDSLNLFPDPSSSFTPNVDGEKYLVLQADSDIYEIRIISPSDLKGGRKQAKAFIRKNGLELNENGNITSYKEIIFSEFELDSNYISLSKLSGYDRGLGDKTPAERKKFGASVVSNLQVYNDLHKTLNKKSSIFRANVNNLHTKIENIGSKEVLESTLLNLQNQETSLENKKLELNNNIVSIQTKISISSEELEKINHINEELKQVQDEISRVRSSIGLFYNKTKIKDIDIEKKLQDDSILLDTYSKSLEETKTSWTIKSERMVSLNQTKQTLQAQLDSYSGNIDEQFESRYNLSCQKLSSIEKELSKYGIDTKNLTNEYIDDLIENIKSLINFCYSFIAKIDRFYDGLSKSDLEIIVGNNPEYSDEYINSMTESITTQIQKLDEDMDRIHGYMKELTILQNRPKKCTIDSCPFIKNAVNIQNIVQSENIELDVELSKILSAKLELSDSLTKIQEKVELMRRLLPKRMEFGSIRDSIIENRDQFLRFNMLELSMVDSFDVMVKNGSLFNNQRDTSILINERNELKQYKAELESNKILFNSLNSYREKLKISDSIRSNIETIDKEIGEISAEVIELRNKLTKDNQLVETLSENVATEKSYLETYNSLLVLLGKESEIKEKIKNINDIANESLQSANVISNMTAEIESINTTLAPIKNQISQIRGQLTLLESYYTEYQEYNQKYMVIETLKKYCSPTAGGIQTVFMQMYMSKTLELANNVLGILFNGEYKLLDFVINEDEFRIPFIGSGLPVDDISSGSASQICIMGTVINLVLLYQASTKYNIARLDEVDAGLDNRNRSGFVDWLRQIMPILNISQLITISHSIEIDSSFVDIIKLKSYPEYETSVTGNVIWDYSEEIKKTIH